MIFLKKQKNKKAGFTLIEMLVAVLIFSVSLTALMTMSARGLRVAKNAQNDVIGDYLAVEAVEVIRNLRDTALLLNTDENTWQAIFFGGEEFLEDEGCFTNLGETNSACSFFRNAENQLQFGPCNECTIFLDTNNDFYFQTRNDDDAVGGAIVDSGFRRRVFVKEVTEGQVLVIVKVDWPNGNVLYTENLFLWQ